MNFSVGIFYAAQKLLDIVTAESATIDDILDSFKRIDSAAADMALAAAQECHWISVGADGRLKLSDAGSAIVACQEPYLRLRLQLRDAISSVSVAWAKRLTNGRDEAAPHLPDDVEQIFKEAGLFGPWTDELLEEWDRLAMSVRNQRNESSKRMSRIAEQLTFKEEHDRTSAEPRWVARDTDFAGYDVLSIVDKNDATPLLIEVKSTSLRLSDAQLFLTRGEWETALTSRNYCLYLWIIKETPEFRVVPSGIIKDHVCIDQRDGKWHQLRLPFKTFWAAATTIAKVAQPT
jgi:uncharacterized protein DUF3883